MRHLYRYRKLHRSPKERKNLFRTMAANLILHQSIKTTFAKASELKMYTNRIINIAKSRRPGNISNLISHPEAIKIVKTELTEKYKNWKNRDYTRILMDGVRHNDKAKKAIIQLLDTEKAMQTDNLPKNVQKVVEKEKMHSFTIRLLNEELEYLNNKKQEYSTAEKQENDGSAEKYKQYIKEADRNIENTKLDILTENIRYERKTIKRKLRELGDHYYQDKGN